MPSKKKGKYYRINKRIKKELDLLIDIMDIKKSIKSVVIQDEEKDLFQKRVVKQQHDFIFMMCMPPIKIEFKDNTLPIFTNFIA